MKLNLRKCLKFDWKPHFCIIKFAYLIVEVLYIGDYPIPPPPLIWMELPLPLLVAPELVWLICFLTLTLVVVFVPLGPATVMTASGSLGVMVTPTSSLSEESDVLSPENGVLRICAAFCNTKWMINIDRSFYLEFFPAKKTISTSTKVWQSTFRNK